jgi:hypothetical protein
MILLILLRKGTSMHQPEIPLGGLTLSEVHEVISDLTSIKQEVLEGINTRSDAQLKQAKKMQAAKQGIQSALKHLHIADNK